MPSQAGTSSEFEVTDMPNPSVPPMRYYHIDLVQYLNTFLFNVTLSKCQAFRIFFLFMVYIVLFFFFWYRSVGVEVHKSASTEPDGNTFLRYS